MKNQVEVQHDNSFNNGSLLSLSTYTQKDKNNNIKRRCDTHTMEYYSAIKKDELLPFATT